MSGDVQTDAYQRNVEALVSKLRRRQIVGSRRAALETLVVLRQVVTKARFSNIEQLVEIIHGAGRRLVEAQPKGQSLTVALPDRHNMDSTEFSVGNTVRKVLHHIREEYRTAAKKVPEDTALSISKLVYQGQPRRRGMAPKSETDVDLKEDDLDDTDSFSRNLKPVFMEAIQDVFDELETVYDSISKSAKDHIHSDEIILTIGQSTTVENFLKAAAHYRNFTVIVAETGPTYQGHRMAQSLSEAGISTFLVPDSSIYAIMSRVNKVILGAHAIIANGGMFAVTGSLLAATAAQAHSTPVVVCAGQFKITPLWNLYQDYSALDFSDPSNVLGFEEGDLVDKADVINPYYDYVGPDLVYAYITNDGDHPPTSIYRLIKETYNDEDIEL